MPTIEKQRIHLLLIANLAQPLLLIRHLKAHHPLPMALPLLKPPCIHIPGLGVYHLALAVGLVGGPGAGVGVAVGVAHGAVAVLEAGAEGAGVGVAGEGDGGAGPVGAAVG
jgi:type IV secretory pathway TrbL component